MHKMSFRVPPILSAILHSKICLYFPFLNSVWQKKINAFPFFANAEKKKSPTHQSTMTELLGTKIHQIFQMP